MKINTDYTEDAKGSLKGLKKELEKNILNLKNIELPIFCIVINQLDSTINTIEELEKFVNIFNNNTLEEILKNKETTDTPLENDSEYHFDNDALKKSLRNLPSSKVKHIISKTSNDLKIENCDDVYAESLK